MSIDIRSWTGLLCAAKSHGLIVFEPENRLDFFVYVNPSHDFSEDALRSNYHLHIFLASDIQVVKVGDVVSWRIETILPKTAFVGSGERPNLAEKNPDDWLGVVQNMNPKCTATEQAARLFAAVVKSQQTVHMNAGSFKVMT